MPRQWPGATGNYLDYGNSFSLAGNTFTISIWVLLTSGVGQVIVTNRNTGNQDGTFWIRHNGSVWEFMVKPEGSTLTQVCTGTSTPRVGVWTHLAARQDNVTGVTSLWVNGIKEATSGLRNTSSGQSIRVGQYINAAGAAFMLAEHFAMWQYALKDGDVMRLAQGALPNAIEFGKLGIWTPYGTGGTAYDKSIRQNAGTQTGSVPPVRDPQAIEIAYGSAVFMPSAPGVIVIEVDVPLGLAGATGFEPVLEGPVDLEVPVGLVGVTGFEPAVVGELTPPVGYAEPTTMGVTLIEGALPPYVPPSLPPTIPPGTPTGPGVPLPPLSSGGLAGIRFYQGPPWRWVVTDLDTNTITFLDRLAFGAEVTYRLNGGSTAKLRIPSANPEVNILHTDGEPFVSEGNRLLYGFRREGETPLWKVRFAGKILMVEDSGETENAQTTITAFDPWHLLYQHPMVDEIGEFPDDAGFFSFDDTQAGNIALIFLRNTILNNGSGLNDHGDLGIDTGDGPFPGAEPGNLPGTGFWDGVYEPTTQRDTFCQQGMMVGEVWDQQLETGSLDIVMTPVYDPTNRPGYMADLSIFETAGSQKDDAVFAWDKPGRNLTAINSLKDGTKRANTIRYYYGEGGPPSGGGIPLSYGPSILKYGETWHQQFYPGRIDVVVNALATLQLLLMEDGIKTVHVTPAPERMPFLFTEFWLGDTVPVFASSNLRQEIAGYQRIYGVVLSIDENSYEQVPQLLVSPEDA